MATLKQRIKKKNTSGTYDTLHIETNSNLVLMDNGNTVQYEMYNHTHTTGQITNFPSSMTPTYHTHPKSQITDFPSSMPPDYHTHSTGDIWNFPSTMAPSYHTHSTGDIWNFPSTMAPSWHQHYASDILNLPAAGMQIKTGSGRSPVDIGASVKAFISYYEAYNTYYLSFDNGYQCFEIAIKGSTITSCSFSKTRISGTQIFCGPGNSGSYYIAFY